MVPFPFFLFYGFDTLDNPTVLFEMSSEYIKNTLYRIRVPRTSCWGWPWAWPPSMEPVAFFHYQVYMFAFVIWEYLGVDPSRLWEYLEFLKPSFSNRIVHQWVLSVAVAATVFKWQSSVSLMSFINWNSAERRNF